MPGTQVKNDNGLGHGTRMGKVNLFDYKEALDFKKLGEKIGGKNLDGDRRTSD